MIVLSDGTVIDQSLLTRIALKCVLTVKNAAPNPSTRYRPGGSTGNLAYNAVKYAIRDVDKMQFEIYVDSNIAPYMQHVSNKTNWADGRAYEYHKWFDKATAEVAEYIGIVLGGKVIKS